MINFAKKAVLNNMNLYFSFLNFHQSHSPTQAFRLSRFLKTVICIHAMPKGCYGYGYDVRHLSSLTNYIPRTKDV